MGKDGYIKMNKKKTYVAPSAEVLFSLGDFAMGSNELPGDEFYPDNATPTHDL